MLPATGLLPSRLQTVPAASTRVDSSDCPPTQDRAVTFHTPDPGSSPLAPSASQPAPLPVVMTPELASTHPCPQPALPAPLSFSIPLRESPAAPSWQELLGQR